MTVRIERDGVVIEITFPANATAEQVKAVVVAALNKPDTTTTYIPYPVIQYPQPWWPNPWTVTYTNGATVAYVNET